MADFFRILAVCTGNVCRSPLAEQLLAQGLRDVSQIAVSSVGTHALVGEHMTEQSQAIARGLGVENPERHEPRVMTEQVLDSAEFILALSREHRRAIVEESPRASRRVFTLREFARLAEATTDDDLLWEIKETSREPVARLKAAVRAVTAGRSTVPLPADRSQDDVIDPYGRNNETYALSTEQIVPAVESTVAFLRRALEVDG